MNKGKILALDYGEKRIGVSISDSSRQLCFIRPFIANEGDLNVACAKVIQFCEQEAVKEIIVGLPLNTGGSMSAQAEKNLLFSECLQKHGKIPVVNVDESFSTFEATEMYKEAGFAPEEYVNLKDSMSAYVLLQKYIK